MRLIRVRPDIDAGFRRVRSRDGFRYVDRAGHGADAQALERIRDLVIPPAWENVWIARDPRAHIQAVGQDAAARRQYLYHPEWRRRRDRNKFNRALSLAQMLPHARRRVTIALRDESLSREKVLAVAFRILDQAAPRVGSPRYLLRNGSRGLTTLRRRDATVDGSAVTLAFRGKSRQRVHLEISDQDLADALAVLMEGSPRAALLWYPHGRRKVAVTAAEVNDHILELTGARFTAKDFRTLRGTIHAAEALAQIGPAQTTTERRAAERLAVGATAHTLGNTPAVARSSYVDPRVFRRYAHGQTLDLTLSPEVAIVRLIEP